jgi:hypothetical protein
MEYVLSNFESFENQENQIENLIVIYSECHAMK